MTTAARYWMVKQEPTTYPWAEFVKDGRAVWTGVRNYQARNNLRAMRTGDQVLYYHSVVGKQVVGIAKVVREAYPDPSATEGDWSCVDLAPLKALAKPVTLEAIKTDPELKEIALVRQSRLSVIPLSGPEFKKVVTLGNSPD